jgi:hypothetical protein
MSDIVCTLPSRQPLTFLNTVSFYKITGPSKKIIVKANYTDEAISCLLTWRRHKHSNKLQFQLATCTATQRLALLCVLYTKFKMKSTRTFMLSICPIVQKLKLEKRCEDFDDIKYQSYVTGDHPEFVHSVSYNWC